MLSRVQRHFAQLHYNGRNFDSWLYFSNPSGTTVSTIAMASTANSTQKSREGAVISKA